MPDKLLKEIKQVLAQVPVDFGGGCSVRKAYVMAWLIRRFRLTLTLDIGVYRGRSLFPQAIAHRQSENGTVYGVDPWSATEADENDNHELREKIKTFVATTDFEGLFQQVSQRLEDFKLSTHTKIVRTTSAQAAQRFAAEGVSFGLIHIDGNHDTSAVMQDVQLYLPLLKPGGFLVMDDISWESVQPAVHEVASRTQPLLNCVIPNVDDYAVFQKGDSSWLATSILRGRLRRLAHA